MHDSRSAGPSKREHPPARRAPPLGPAARSMRFFGVPRRTAALIGANALGACVQGQFQFVLPWMLLSRGHSPQTAAFAAGLVYAPLLLTAIPAGAASDNTDPRRLMRIATVVMLVVCALYPIAELFGHDWFVLILIAAVVGRRRRATSARAPCSAASATRPRPDRHAPARPRAALDRQPGGGVRQPVRRPPALSASAAPRAVHHRHLRAAGRRDRHPRPRARARARAGADGGDARERRRRHRVPAANARLRTIGWANLTWNVFAGAAIGIMPAVLREHLGMNELMASATFIAGAVVVVLLTLPVVRTAQRRVRSGPHLHRRDHDAGDRDRPLRRPPRRRRRAARLLRLPALEQRRRSVAQRRPRRRGRARPPGAAQHGADHGRDDRLHRRRRARRRRCSASSASASSWP